MGKSKKYGGRDISTLFTKQKNRECGRMGYCRFKEEKITTISPRDYGMFLQKH